MSGKFTCTLLVLAVAVLIHASEACTSHTQLKTHIDAILQQNQAALDRTTPGVYVQQQNKTSHQWVDLYTLRHQEYHTPASNNKVLTTAAIISSLGPTYVIETPISGTGQTPHEPYLCVKGMGDPSMTWNSVVAMAVALKQKNVASIETVILDDSLYQPSFPDGWEWGDLVYYYGAQPSSFIVDENVLTFTISPGPSVGAPVVVHPYGHPLGGPLNIVRADSSQTGPAGSASTVDVSWRIGSNDIFVIGSLPMGSSPVTLQAAVPQPTQRFAQYLSSAFAELEITVGRPITTGSCANAGVPLKVLTTIQSDTLGKMVNHTLQVSDNLMAEVWSRYLGHKTNAPGGSATSRGVAAVSQALGKLGVDSKTFRQRDGSGLDCANLVTPFSLVNTVKAMGTTPYAAEYKSYLPNSYPGGMLYSRFVGTPAVGRVFAKTGYISLVSSLSGWVDSDKLFSIMLDQSPTDSTTRKHIIDQIVLAVADLCPLH